MEVKRFKIKTGQRIWRVTWGKDGSYLGRTVTGIWPKPSVGTPLDMPTKAQSFYRSACVAVNQLSPNRDEKGFFWLVESYAELAIRIVKLQKTGWKPVQGWAIRALQNGWDPPEGWSVNDGD